MPEQIISNIPIQTNESDDFKGFMDNHVRTTTKFQSAEELLKGAEFNVTELAEQLGRSASFFRLFEKNKLDSDMKRPLLPLNLGQVGLVGGSGLLNGLVECDTPHIIKGRIVKENNINREENLNSKGELTSTTVYETRCCILQVYPCHDKKDTAENLLKKLRELSKDDCRELICDIQRNYHLPHRARTVREMIAVALQKSVARKLEGHDIMALERFDPEVEHMIVFDVLSEKSPIGDKGSRMRLFLTETGYKKALENQDRHFILILNYAKVAQGNLRYDWPDRYL